MPEINIGELNEMYDEAEQADRNLFSEYRTQILLVQGDHFTSRRYPFGNIRTKFEEGSSTAKIRITKNYIQYVTKKYINNLISQNPSVTVLPYNESVLANQKAAELNKAVLDDIKRRHRSQNLIFRFAKDYVDIGEVHAKTFWDWEKGEFIGYEGTINADGELDTGSDEKNRSAIFSGDICIERAFAFNRLRDPSAEEWSKCDWHINRKMMSIKKLKQLFSEDDSRNEFLHESSGDMHKVFDASNGLYYNTKGQSEVREYYWPKSTKYPNGYFIIATQAGKLFEGELPYGIDPMDQEVFDEMQTSPRGRSIIKQIRSPQGEANRAASSQAMAQLTMGDDKLLYPSGSTIAKGSELPGIRGVKYTGQQPVVLEGRTGEQFTNFYDRTVQEILTLSMVTDDAQEKQIQDPQAMLFRSLKDQKQFQIYSSKFESFLVRVFEKALAIHKEYVTDDSLIQITGKQECLNIPEYKSTSPLHFQIKIEPMSDDINSTMGKFMELSTILQYVGKDLSPEERGMIIRNMKFVNESQIMKNMNMTIDYDSCTNDILAMDRGEYRPAHESDNHDYYLKRLSARIKEQDYQLLNPQIQQAYQKKVAEHSQMKAEQLRKIQAAEAGFIPTSGGYSKVDLYINPDPANPHKQQRATLPTDALRWLMKKLEDQGTSQASISKADESVKAQVAQDLMQQQSQPQPMLPLLAGQQGDTGQSSHIFEAPTGTI